MNCLGFLLALYQTLEDAPNGSGIRVNRYKATLGFILLLLANLCLPGESSAIELAGKGICKLGPTRPLAINPNAGEFPEVGPGIMAAEPNQRFWDWVCGR